MQCCSNSLPSSMNGSLDSQSMPQATAAKCNTGYHAPKTTSPPHPEWKPGVKMPNPAGHNRMVEIDPASVSSCYALVISGVVPRPVALVSSQNASGGCNMAPFSYFGAVAHDPPVLTVSICRKPGGCIKDTLANVLETREMVVHIISEWFVEPASHTCGNFKPDIDEMDVVGFTKVPSVVVKPPRIEEAALAMECKLIDHKDIINSKGEVTTTVLMAEVVRFHVHEDAYDGSNPARPKVKLEALMPIGRLGGDTFCRVHSTFDIPRPVV
eukprot:jgi/Mesvir1/9447/Mv09844-RA.1